MSGPGAQPADPPDHHRPRYHPRPPRGYLNDPNGPIVLDDLVHLYFQSRPTTDMAAPVEWGHLTSEDYVTWRLHRPAMAPVPDGPDRDGCYSGNTVLDDGRIRAFYSGYRTDSPYQSVLTAVSDDGGYSFGPPSQVVPDPAPEEDAIMFRDPFVWKVDDGWQMVVGAGYADGRSAVRHYLSADLHEWTRLDDLAFLAGQDGDGPEVGDAWECPQVLDLAGRSVAIVGTWSRARGVNSVLSLLVGEPTRLSIVDHGTNFYAASALRDGPFGPLLFGWVTEGRPASQWHEAGWAGALSLPRQVWLDDDGSLRSAPLPTTAELRVGPATRASEARVSPQCEIVVPSAGARVRLQFGDEEYLEVICDAEANALIIDRTGASSRADVHGGTVTAPDAFDAAAGRPAARIFVDGSVVEVFTSAGRVLTTRVYPVGAPPWRIAAPDGCTVWALAGELPSAVGSAELVAGGASA
ncbi:glycoside hydrolase family 32 protein [Microlunatus ginsengisoli]|uniref:beta-fructofuranosidase n=1 Tax=Microlunatus ginsengisoli TaxID=363863 RepID=A0ABP6ZWA0_9ACTN